MDRLLRRLFPKPPEAGAFADYANVTLTLRRLFNLHLVNFEKQTNRTRLRSRPLKLVIEATNVCNLECPYCFTGMGENGRVRSHIDFDFYKRALDEQARDLLEVEFFNWGEPLLNMAIFRMVAEAARRGVATTISTNFSLPFDADKAETLVRSGLTHLYVSFDGMTQESYQTYRRGGDLALVKRNVRLVADAKARLGSASPQISMGWHTFPHNLHEVEEAQRRATELGFDQALISKGYQLGEDWEGPGQFGLHKMGVGNCFFLWQYSVIHNDGGVAPCCASFYREDDVGRMRTTPKGAGSRTFAEIWNGPEMQEARGYFKTDAKLGDGPHVCRSCPVTLNWHDLLGHMTSGAPPQAFVSRFAENSIANYINERRPKTRDTTKPLRKEARTPREPETASAVGHTVIANGRKTRP